MIRQRSAKHSERYCYHSPEDSETDKEQPMVKEKLSFITLSWVPMRLIKFSPKRLDTHGFLYRRAAINGVGGTYDDESYVSPHDTLKMLRTWAIQNFKYCTRRYGFSGPENSGEMRIAVTN
ncbi:unnamed protein product [Rhizophagus irregularis]|nr:unnamed protein product [Rhizophagus irregularis]